MKLKGSNMKLLTIGAVSIVALLVFRNDIGELFAGKSKNKYKTESKKFEAVQIPVSAGITVKERWEMPEDLREISGLTNLDNDRFACVQDEKGSVFIYNIAMKKVEKEIPFGGSGEYEGIARAGENIYVVQSNGTISEISQYKTGKPTVQEYKTSLTTEQNVEGLCYDQARNRLLIAIKGEDAHSKEYKGVYAFDIRAKKMAEQPVYHIELGDDVFKNLGGKKPGSAMNPSSIAVHPVTDDIYITDGSKSRLLIMTQSGI